jgi:GAF domain-containing protein
LDLKVPSADHQRCTPGINDVTARTATVTSTRTFAAAPGAGAGRRGAAGNAIKSVAASAGPRQPQESLIAVVGLLVTGQSLEKTLGHVLELACAALPGGDEGGITLLEADGPGTVIATNDVVRRLDRAQCGAETGGPRLDACWRQEIRHIDSTASDQRWPEFSGTAIAEGIASTVSIPLVVSGDGLGTLNIYCYRENGFPATDERLAVALGRCGSAALANARAYWRMARLAG